MTTEHDNAERDNAQVSGRSPADSSGDVVGPDKLAVELSELARSWQQAADLDAMLAQFVQAAVDLVPGAQHASISEVIDRRRVESRAPSGELPRRVDEVMDEVGQGPCLDAIYEETTVGVPDLRSEDRWPDFCARAVELGVVSMLAFQLYVEGDNLGALNLYAEEPGAFGEESEHVGLLIAAHAAVALADANRVSQLKWGMETRDVIGQAKGILMARYGLTGITAFNTLARFSQEKNLKLREVADQIVDQHESQARR